MKRKWRDGGGGGGGGSDRGVRAYWQSRARMPLIVEMHFAKRYSSSRMLFWNEYFHMYIARVRVSFDAFVVYMFLQEDWSVWH